jgi:hypothetical protein
MRKSFLSMLSFAFLALPMYAADTNHDGFETILFPIAIVGSSNNTVPGAYGTQWQGEIWVRNASLVTVLLEGRPPCPFENCTSPVAAGFTGRFAPGVAASGTRGLLLEPRVEDAASVTFSNRVSEVTRHAQPQGFEVPVVREGDFFTGPSDFLGLPGGVAVRSTLRIYDPRRVPGTAVTVQILDSTNKVVGETTVATTFSNATPADTVEPGFAMLDLGSIFPVIAGLDRYHVRVTPVTTGSEYWAIASVTDNDTQQVLIVTPQ